MYKYPDFLSFLTERLSVPNAARGLRKRRHAQPQIHDADKQAFLDDLKDNNIRVTYSKVDPRTLIPSQVNFSEERVERIVRKKTWNKFDILISSDNYVIDGMHRWLAAVSAGDKIRTQKIGLTAKELYKFLKDKPYVKRQNIKGDYV